MKKNYFSLYFLFEALSQLSLVFLGFVAWWIFAVAWWNFEDWIESCKRD